MASGFEPATGVRVQPRVGARVFFVAAALGYLLIFASTYLSYTYERYAYLGFGNGDDLQASSRLAVLALAMLPAFFLPLEINRPSRLFLLVQYFVIYVPAVWMAAHATLPALDTARRWSVCLTLLAGMMVLIWASWRWKLLRMPSFVVPQWPLWVCIYAGALACLLLLISIFGVEFRLVSLRDIYLLREAASDLLQEANSRWGAYAFLWLNNFFLPIIFANALIRRRVVVLIGVVACYLFLFGTWGSKASLLAPVILLLISLYSALPEGRRAVLFPVALGALLLVPISVDFESDIAQLMKTWWLAIVHMRTFAIPGLLVVQYSDFFSDHALTLGSHVSGLGLLIHNPYDYDIPRTVGFYYYGDLMTANANFWAQDGMAGLGLPGVVIMSGVAAAVFWLLDSVTRHLPLRFVLVALGCVLLIFANVSLFTTLLSGGLALFMGVSPLLSMVRQPVSE